MKENAIATILVALTEAGYEIRKLEEVMGTIVLAIDPMKAEPEPEPAQRKVTVEIEMTEEEEKRFERYLEEGSYDAAKLLNKWIFGGLDKIEHFARLCRPRYS